MVTSKGGVVHRLGIVGGELVEGAVVVVIDAVEALDDVPVSTQAHSGAGAGGIEAGRSVSGTSGDHAAATVGGIGGTGSGTLVARAATAAGETKAGDSSDTAGEGRGTNAWTYPLLMMAMSSPINRESYPGAPRLAPAQLADDISLPTDKPNLGAALGDRYIHPLERYLLPFTEIVDKQIGRQYASTR